MTRKKRKIEDKVREFQEWFYNTYTRNISYYSPAYTSEKSNKAQDQKAQRIVEVTSNIIQNGDSTDAQLGRKVALRYFVTMRTALDYLNYAQLMLDEWIEKR